MECQMLSNKAFPSDFDLFGNFKFYWTQNYDQSLWAHFKIIQLDSDHEVLGICVSHQLTFNFSHIISVWKSFLSLPFASSNCLIKLSWSQSLSSIPKLFHTLSKELCLIFLSFPHLRDDVFDFKEWLWLLSETLIVLVFHFICTAICLVASKFKWML